MKNRQKLVHRKAASLKSELVERNRERGNDWKKKWVSEWVSALKLFEVKQVKTLGRYWIALNLNTEDDLKLFGRRKSKSLSFYVEWYINLCGLFNAKAILLEEQ